MKKTILAALVLLPHLSYANEAKCLARILHAEDRKTITGAIEVANASINRSNAQQKSICRITGVERSEPPTKYRPYFEALAQAALASPRLNDADSWDAGRKPHLPGDIRQYAGGQTFYKMKQKKKRS